MNFTDMSCTEFVQVLATKQPVPGGGGASALAGAVGTALGNMVGSLTLGKKKYADVQEDIVVLKAKADALQSELLRLVQADAEVFQPLSVAYGMPDETEEEKAKKHVVMQDALQKACEVPLDIMQKCCNAITLHEEFERKGSVLAISDVGVGVILCKAALQGAALNVYINTKLITNRAVADAANEKAEKMLTQFLPLADSIYDKVRARLC